MYTKIDRKYTLLQNWVLHIFDSMKNIKLLLELELKCEKYDSLSIQLPMAYRWKVTTFYHSRHWCTNSQKPKSHTTICNKLLPTNFVMYQIFSQQNYFQTLSMDVNVDGISAT